MIKLKTSAILSLVLATAAGSGYLYAASNPAPLDNITSLPPVTAGDPNPGQPSLITDPSVALPKPSNLAAFVRDESAQRVLYDKAPFDHPQIFIPNGHPTVSAGSTTPVPRGNTNGTPIAKDDLLEIKAIGAAGVATPRANFLGLP